MAYNLYEMIPIYKEEQKLGLSQAILDNRTLAYCSVARPKDIGNKIDYEAFFAKARTANPDQLDLYYLDSVLVSVGWNKNDDIFIPEQVWAARKTPVDKKFNFMHNEKDIIGHMTDSYAVDKDGSIIPDDLSFDEIPNEFDIVVASVLYKTWNDEELQDRMDQIIEDIPNDKWFVSMECLFANFSYGLETDDGPKIIPRNKATAFLTKHLRAYGGDGYFDGKKIGRVLGNFFFSGKGLVDKPANEASIIFNKNNPFNATIATLNKEDKIFITVAGEQNMSDVNDKALASLEAKVEKLEAEKESLKAKFEAEANKASAAEIQGLKDEIEALKEQVSAKDQLIANKDKEVAEATKTVEATAKEKTDLETKLAEISQAKIRTDRISLLVEASVSKDEAESITDKWASASDEQFAEVVKLYTEAMKDKKEDKDEKGKNFKTKGTDEAKASEEVEELNDELEEAEASTDVTDTVDEQDDTSELHAAAASWLENVFNNK